MNRALTGVVVFAPIFEGSCRICHSTMPGLRLVALAGRSNRKL